MIVARHEVPGVIKRAPSQRDDSNLDCQDISTGMSSVSKAEHELQFRRQISLIM